MSSTAYNPAAIAVQAPQGRAIAKARPAADGASRSGIWVAIFAITMSFAAFTSALFVREGTSGDWTHLTLPSIIYANTLVILLSSVTLTMASRAVKSRSYMEPEAVNAVMAWLVATFALGLLVHRRTIRGLAPTGDPRDCICRLIPIAPFFTYLPGCISCTLLVGLPRWFISLVNWLGVTRHFAAHFS